MRADWNLEFFPPFDGLRSSKQMIYTRKIGGGEDALLHAIPIGIK